jgi:hypothetical protein
MKTLLNILVVAALAATGAMADITVTFDQPHQIGNAGDTLYFLGVISNTGLETVYLNSDNLNLAGTGLTTVDNFFANVPFSLAPGASSPIDPVNDPHIDLFDVTVSNPLSDAPGTYQGTYNLLGGVDGSAQDNLVTVPFDITLPGASVPEPSVPSLLGAELAALLVGLAMACRLRWRRA